MEAAGVPEGAVEEAEDVHAVTISTATATPAIAEPVVLIQQSPAAGSVPLADTRP